ncbi:trypsin-like serine peptidase [Streptacidiphilus monticola]|uniref:Trypsin-like serine peptidase n=1 Tax=Streptacidiphilus monticola TaxID=2161674 RepID=A0ABW1G0G1_9ACTN
MTPLRFPRAAAAWLVLLTAGFCTTVSDQASADGLGIGRLAPAGAAAARIGALFSGGDHFCTASVVDSPAGNLVITAAHCLSGGASGVSFAPGYRAGTAPYGSWPVTAVVVDDAWSQDEDEDHDVAFAVLGPDSQGRSVQQVVGAEEFDAETDPAAAAAAEPVSLTGYPDGDDDPITCRNLVDHYSATQLRIACTGYTDGTSGSPWLLGDRVVGVIGGFEQGGATPDVSYSVRFGTDAAVLYAQAVTGSR